LETKKYKQKDIVRAIDKNESHGNKMNSYEGINNSCGQEQLNIFSFQLVIPLIVS